MSRLIYVSGCSFTHGASWVNNLFENDSVENFAAVGAGNCYIADSIIHFINKNKKPDYVFALFSGINRVDTVVPYSNLVKNSLETIQLRHAVLGSSAYFFSGGDRYTKLVKDNYKNINQFQWPEVNSIEDFYTLSQEQQQHCVNSNIFWWQDSGIENIINSYTMLQYLNNSEFLSDQTYQAIERFQNCLYRHNINYNFGFIHDPFDRGHHKHLGFLNKHSSRYHSIDWSKYVKISPYEFGVKHNLVSADGFHICPEGMNKWADSIKQFFKT